MSDLLANLRNPPRQLSIDSPDYDPALGVAIEVWLDGYEQHQVLAYDCDAGTVQRYKVTGFGEVFADGDQIACEIVTGDVQVRWRDRV